MRLAQRTIESHNLLSFEHGDIIEGRAGLASLAWSSDSNAPHGPFPVMYVSSVGENSSA